MDEAELRSVAPDDVVVPSDALHEERAYDAPHVGFPRRAQGVEGERADGAVLLEFRPETIEGSLELQSCAAYAAVDGRVEGKEVERFGEVVAFRGVPVEPPVDFERLRPREVVDALGESGDCAPCGIQRALRDAQVGSASPVERVVDEPAFMSEDDLRRFKEFIHYLHPQIHSITPIAAVVIVKSKPKNLKSLTLITPLQSLLSPAYQRRGKKMPALVDEDGHCCEEDHLTIEVSHVVAAICSKAASRVPAVSVVIAPR